MGIKKRQVVEQGVGGPGTVRGINFQLKYAVLRAFKAIQHHLVFPLDDPVIQPEPRAGYGELATGWDLRISLPENLVEVKSNPTRLDVTEFLDRVQRAEEPGDSNARYLLVYGRGSNALLNALDQLSRTAAEARGNASDFDRLRGIKDIANADDLLAHLGVDAVALLCRIDLKNYPKAVLEDLLRVHADALAGPLSSRLISLISTLLSEATAKRAAFTAVELIAHCCSAGIDLYSPAKAELGPEERDLVDALSILQSAADGLPIEVITKSLHQNADSLEDRFRTLEARKLVTQGGRRWKLIPHPRKLAPSSPDVLVHALQTALLWISSRKGEQISQADIMHAVRLAELTTLNRPEAVARIFIYLDKPLKRLGDKHLMLRTANLAIDAARASAAPRSPEVVKGEAQALICGRSWVYQRIDRLEDAKISAALSKKLGTAVGWHRNTAFSQKCIGRLSRLEAEKAENPLIKEELFRQSVRQLEEAIRSFTALDEMQEAGDCYSLIGRTYFAAGRIRDAEAAAVQAEALVTDFEGKDYFDLLILMGDIAAARLEFLKAEAIYGEAVQIRSSADSERCEILARACFQRGRCYQLQKKKASAIRDFDEAAKIWMRLGEREMQSKAVWERMNLSANLSADLRHALQGESATIRVRVVEIHEQRLASATSSTAKRMNTPPPSYWTELIKQAQHQEASESPEW